MIWRRRLSDYVGPDKEWVPSSTTEYEENPSEFNIERIPVHCHRFVPGADKAFCGMPRAEQAKHGAPENPLSDPCKYCGYKLCPKCKAVFELRRIE